MDLEKQVCLLELSKRLKELGVKQDSLFYWWCRQDKDLPMLYNKCSIIYTKGKNIDDNYISAFTVAELGELLPNRITISEDNIPFDSFTIVIKKFYTVNEDRSTTNNYLLNYECDSTEIAGENAWLRRHLMNNIYDPNLANAMARMLIYLIENGFMKNE